MSGLDEIDVDEKEFNKMEAMIRSMTPEERREKVELVPSRRRRIANGSGTKIDDVNRMVKGFKKIKQFCKDMPHLKQQMEKGGKFPFPGKMPWGN